MSILDNPAVGIDLGTTNTVVAAQTSPHGAEVIGARLPSDRGRRDFEEFNCIRSAVYFESRDRAVVGPFAAQHPDGIRSIKSRMGTRWRRRLRTAGGEVPVTPAFVSAHILIAARDAVIRRFPQWDGSAVITVPASFTTDQRLDTLNAARLAGIAAVELMDEPVAAFYNHFHQIRDAASPTSRTVMIFDFGGGTLDVSIVRMRAPTSGHVQLDAIGRSRYNNLGGDDIDRDLASFLLGAWEFDQGKELSSQSDATQSILYREFLRRACEFKERAEDRSEGGPERLDFNVYVPLSGSAPLSFTRRLTEAQYREASGRYFRTDAELNIYCPIDQALSTARRVDADFRESDVSLILFTGGVTRMAAVQIELRRRFPGIDVEPVDDMPCHSVAVGAAVRRHDMLCGEVRYGMTGRLLEAVYTLDASSENFIELVPVYVDALPDFDRCPHRFRLARDSIVLRLPLYRGVSAEDHQLWPMEPIEFSFPRPLPAGCEYEIWYRLSGNKTLELRCVFSTGGTLSIDARVEMDPRLASREVPPVCKVNAE